MLPSPPTLSNSSTSTSDFIRQFSTTVNIISIKKHRAEAYIAHRIVASSLRSPPSIYPKQSQFLGELKKHTMANKNGKKLSNSNHVAPNQPIASCYIVDTSITTLSGLSYGSTGVGGKLVSSQRARRGAYLELVASKKRKRNKG